MKINIIPHPTEGFNYYWTCPRGELIVKSGLEQIPDVELVKPEDADYFFHIYVPHNNGVKCDDIISRYPADKLIIIDWTDENELLYDKFKLYFKRSLVSPITQVNSNIVCHEKIIINSFLKNVNILPISYCALPGFFFEERQRTIDLGCYLRYTCPNRNIVLEFCKQLQKQIVSNYKSFVGEINNSSRSIKSEVHYDQDYLVILANTRINVTCNPTWWEGDSRLWEGLANGCCVFVDKMFVPKYDFPNDLQHNKHLFYYELTKEGMEEFIHTVYRCLEDKELASQIGKNGQELVKQHHMPVNRMQYVINTIKVYNE